MSDYSSFCVYLKREVVEKMDKIAKEIKRSRSYVIQMMAEEYFKQRERGNK